MQTALGTLEPSGVRLTFGNLFRRFSVRVRCYQHRTRSFIRLPLESMWHVRLGRALNMMWVEVIHGQAGHMHTFVHKSQGL